MDIHTPENVTVVDSYSIASPYERIIAFLIDLVVYSISYFVLTWIFGLFGMPWIGGVLAVLYLIFRDGLTIFNYQSIGKKIMKLKVIRFNDQLRVGLLESVKRNFVLLPAFFYPFGISFLYGSGIITIFLLLIELYQLYTNEDYQRLGDQFADTIVIEKP